MKRSATYLYLRIHKIKPKVRSLSTFWSEIKGIITNLEYDAG